MRRFFIALALSVSACATSGQGSDPGVDAQLEAERLNEARQFIRHWERLSRVHGQVMQANTELCERTHIKLGVIMHELSDYPLDLRDVVSTQYGVKEFPTILTVQDSRLAGVLEPGDVVLDRHDAPSFPYMQDVQQYMIAGFIRIKRKEELMILPVKAPKTCSYRTALTSDRHINASAENGEIKVTTALMDVAKSDDELGFIISHELAHYTQSHVQLIGNDLNARPVAQSNKSSKEQEVEADYAGLYYAIRAGYELEKINVFWGRIKSTGLLSFFSFLSSYPDLKEREVYLTRIGEDIEEKVRLGQPLEP